MCAKSIEGRRACMGQITHARNFCRRLLLGQRRRRARVYAVVMRDFALGLSPLHTREKKFYVPCTHCRRTKTYPDYAVSCKYSQNALQTGPAKRARDGIEWITNTRSALAPSIGVRACESMTFADSFVCGL